MARKNTNTRLLRLARRRKAKEGKVSSYEKMMKTLLLQNQQIIIQQQNMMFMVIKQLQHPAQNQLTSSTTTIATSNNLQQSQQHHHHQQAQQQQHNHDRQQQQQQHHQETHQVQHHLQTQHHHVHEDHTLHQTHQLFSQASQQSSSSNILDTEHQLQQVAAQLHENMSSYLTPAASEQDPISDKADDDDLVALLEGDGLLHNNLLYNPQTDIGSVTPYKNHQQPLQNPSYYSSGCESLSTPRLETQRQPQTANISQNVVKNLAQSFKSPTKPKINVQILSGSATGSMKNSKAKIIQRMNISEFLRHVHPETDETQKNNNQ